MSSSTRSNASSLQADEACVSPETWALTGRSIGEAFADVAASQPAALAVVDDAIELCYAQLEQVSRSWAETLHASGAGPHAVVGVFLPLGAAHIAAVLAVLRSGRIYVSLDPVYPRPRLLSMMAAAGVDRVLTMEEWLAPAAELGTKTINLVPVAEVPTTNDPMTEVPAVAESFAGLYFTSGSTGVPKAVAHTHRNILFDIGRQTRDMNVTPADRFDLLFSPSFSAFLSPVFGALLTGASVHAFDLRSQSVAALHAWLEQSGITVSTASVSTFRRLIAVLPEGRVLPRLRMLSLGAEPLRTSDVAHFCTHFSADCMLQNALATTETRTIAQDYLSAGAAVPKRICVGHPISGKQLVLLDERGQPAPAGASGEIVIRSAFISPGTWSELRSLPEGRLPEPRVTTHRTGDLARRLPDGRIQHLGRIDDQIKVRGHRIEAAEIESHLLTHPAVRDAAVFMLDEETPEGGRHWLLALWVRGVDAAAVDLRKFLQGLLPDYMVPNQVLEVPALPLTDTGKLNRRQLPEVWRRHALQSVPSTRPPAGIGEDWLRSLWQRVLNVAWVDETDDFFVLGGDSLAAADLMTEVKRQCRVEAPASWLLSAPTLSEFRLRVFGPNATKESGGIRRMRLVESARPGAGRPLYLLPPWNHSAVLFRDLKRSASGGRDIWALEGFDTATIPARSIEAMAEQVAGVLQAWHPERDFDLGGYSMGGFVAWAVAERMMHDEEWNGGLFLIDTSRFYGAKDAAQLDRLAESRTWGNKLSLGLAHCLRPRGVPRWPIIQRLFLGKLDWWLLGRWRRRQTDPYAEAYADNIKMSQNYKIPPYAGPVVLFRARRQENWQNLVSADLGWTELCRGGLQVVELPGGHSDLLRGPNAIRLADRLMCG